MQILDVLSRIVHVGTAITLIGGSVFMLLVLMPAARQLSGDAHDKLASEIQSRWKKFVGIGVVLFLVSGLYNYTQAIPDHKGDGLYHALIGTKILLAMFVFFIAAALVGRSAKLQPMRENRRKWLTVLVLAAAIIIAISGFAKVRGVPDEVIPAVEAPVERIVDGAT